MSLKIYLDDCAYAKALVALLRSAGHQVLTPVEAGTLGRRDEVHFQYAVAHGLTLLTRNPDDFARLHEACREHAGILVIYQDNDRQRDMSYADIVKAIANLEQAGMTVERSFHVLNAWRY